VLGSGSGAVDTAGELAGSGSEVSLAARQPAVGRVDSYVEGVVASSSLVSARLGPGDNEVRMCDITCRTQGSLALARWTGYSGILVGRYVKC